VVTVWNEVLMICIFAGTTTTLSSLASLKLKIVYVLVQRTQVVLKYLEAVKRVLSSLQYLGWKDPSMAGNSQRVNDIFSSSNHVRGHVSKCFFLVFVCYCDVY